MTFLSNMCGLTLASLWLAWPLYLVAVVGLFRRRSDSRTTLPLMLSLLIPLTLPCWTAITVGPHVLMTGRTSTETPSEMRILDLLAMLALFVSGAIWWRSRAARKLNTLCAIAALLCTCTAYVVCNMTITNSWP